MNPFSTLLTLPRRARWRYRIHSWDVGYPDPEMRYLPKLCSPAKISVDVGASQGLYTAHLLTCSRAVWAFEPRQEAATELQRLYSNEAVRVDSSALSDFDGEASMVICQSDLGRSTLEQSNPVAGDTKYVNTRRLDSFDLRPVGFIKIDVEGYEDAVLRGGRVTLMRERPNLLIEIEERHKVGATKGIPKMLEDLGYAGWFLFEGEWRPFSTFEVSKHQRINELPYINNFVFLPSERKNPLL